MWYRCLKVLAVCAISTGLVSCHENDPLARVPTFSIGGTVAGASGLLTLQNSNGTTLRVAENGSFAFATPMVNGATYNVTVVVPPAAQTCKVSNGAGLVGVSDITHVEVSCTPMRWRSRPDPGHHIKLASLTRD